MVREGLTNITCIDKKWEAAPHGADFDERNVVIAAYSLAMLDMKRALSKIRESGSREQGIPVET